MTANAQMISQVRRWTKEPNAPTDTPPGTYTDEAIQALIEQFPKMDERGVAPYWYDTSVDPPQQVTTTGWYPSYDLHAAAATIWEDKAAFLAEALDKPITQPIPGYTKHTQPRDYALQQARYHNARRSAGTATLVVWPSRNRYGNSHVGNLAEGDF